MENSKGPLIIKRIYEYRDSRGVITYKEYYLGDVRHNENGPAIEFLDCSGEDQYYLDGIRLTKEQWTVRCK